MTCAEIVIENAARKAKAVSKKCKTGVIIAADTVVFDGKTLITKPKHLKDAFNTLRALSKKPQWVYTGIAVFDVDNKKMITSYDKTKVFMHNLTDDEIRAYFKKVSPMDKAGSYGIQGQGAFLVREIIGSYSNVVGMPLVECIEMFIRHGVVEL